MSSPASLQLSTRALRDLRRIGPGPEAARLRSALESLAAGAGNLDIKVIADHPGWRRLRVGDWRVLYVGCRTADGGWSASSAAATWNVRSRPCDVHTPETHRSGQVQVSGMFQGFETGGVREVRIRWYTVGPGRSAQLVALGLEIRRDASDEPELVDIDFEGDGPTLATAQAVVAALNRRLV